MEGGSGIVVAATGRSCLHWPSLHLGSCWIPPCWLLMALSLAQVRAWQSSRTRWSWPRRGPLARWTSTRRGGRNRRGRGNTKEKGAEGSKSGMHGSSLSDAAAQLGGLIGLLSISKPSDEKVCVKD